MARNIDVTGLPADAVQVVQTLVSLLRNGTKTRAFNLIDPVVWSAELHRWAASHPKRNLVIDDSRETIYAGRGE